MDEFCIEKLFCKLSKSPLKGYILCLWSNIVGPKVERVWQNSREFIFSNELLQSVASLTLAGELCRNLSDECIDFKYFPIDEQHVCILSHIFVSMTSSGRSVHSLSMVLPIGIRSRQIELFCSPWVEASIKKFRTASEKVDILRLIKS